MLFFVGLETIPSYGKATMYEISVDYIIYALSFTAVFYLLYFFITKKYLNKKKAVYLIIFGLLFIIVFTVPVVLIYINILVPEIFKLEGSKFAVECSIYYVSFLETNFLFAMCGSLMKIALLWYENIMKQKEIEKQFVKGELALLRSQINPQFLLNTLKNIKSLIESAPPKAIYSIENLSEIMSYMLYDSSAEKVRLEDEVKYLNNYLDLQKFRFKNSDFYEFNVSGNIFPVYIPPMIFMPFIEIALKNTDVLTEMPAIVINLSAGESEITFEVINRVKENAGCTDNKDKNEIDTIKRRLNLLFEDSYSLEMEEFDEQCIIRLDIKLKGGNINY